MAEKRMLSNQIINSDEFTDMPADAQMLYVRLNLAADDRGICDKPRQIMNVCRVPDDCMKLLIAKKFVLIPRCRPTVVVVKHWWINNNYRSQRFKETRYIDVLDELFYDENRSYSKTPDNHIPCLQCGAPVSLTEVDQWISDGRPMVNQRLTDGRPTVDQRLPQYSIEENSKEESNTVQGRVGDRGPGEEGETQAPSVGCADTSPGGGGTTDDGLTDDRQKQIAVYKNQIGAFRRLGYDPAPIIRKAAMDGITPAELGEATG